MPPVLGLLKAVAHLSAIRRVDVNTSTNRAMIQWDKSVTPLSKIITALHEIGYKAYPFQADLEASSNKLRLYSPWVSPA